MTKRRRLAGGRAPWQRRAGIRLALASAGLAGALAGGFFGLRALRTQAAAWPEAAFDRTMIDAPAPPAWLQRDVLGEAWRTAAGDGPATRLDPGVLGRLGAALERGVWVREPRLQWRAGRLAAEWQWRMPVAALQWTDQQACYLDAEGVAVRPGDVAEAVRRACVIVEIPDLPKQSPPQPGDRLGDPRIPPATRLAAALAQAAAPEFLGARIVPRQAGPAVVVETILHPQGSRALWGVVGPERDLAAAVRTLAEALRKNPERAEYELQTTGVWRRAMLPKLPKNP